MIVQCNQGLKLTFTNLQNASGFGSCKPSVFSEMFGNKGFSTRNLRKKVNIVDKDNATKPKMSAPLASGLLVR